jgi:hypothetical protein
MDKPILHRVAIGRYASAIWEDGIAAMGAGLGIFFTFLAAYYAFVAQHNIAFLWLLALLAFGFAGYRVWLKEHRALLLEEARNANAEITGGVREVFFEKRNEGITPDVFVETPNGFDFKGLKYSYIFNVRLYVANQRAPTTIERFVVRLKSNDTVHDGEKLPIRDMVVERPTGRDQIVDIEDLNDVPLVHSRNGWLHFSAANVQGMGDYYKEPKQQLDIGLVDKNGMSHWITPLPQSEWKKNSRDSAEHVLQVVQRY